MSEELRLSVVAKLGNFPGGQCDIGLFPVPRKYHW